MHIYIYISGNLIVYLIQNYLGSDFLLAVTREMKFFVHGFHLFEEIF